MTLTRNNKKSGWTLPCVALFASLLVPQLAQADLAFVISDASGNTNFTNVQPDSSYNLIIYALVQDSTGTTVGTSGDWFVRAFGGVQVTGSYVSDGDISFPTGANGAGNVQYPTPTTVVTSTVASWGSTSSGTIGIGANSTLAQSTTAGIYASNFGIWKTTTGSGLPNPPSNIISAFSNYTVYPFAEFTMSFGSSLLSGGSASVGFIPGTETVGEGNIWYENTVEKLQNGNGAYVGSGHGSIYAGPYGNGLLDTVTFSTSWFTGAADLSGVAANPSGGLWVGATPPSTAAIVFSGLTTSVSGLITNTINLSPPAGNQDSVNWTMMASGQQGGTITGGTSQTGGPISPGGNSGTVSFTYSANSNFFGPDSVTLTASGTNVNLATSSTAAYPSGLAANINVIGLASKAPGTYGTVGSYGAPMVSEPVTNFANMETALSNTATYGIGSTYALILAGSQSTPTNISMAWRSRTSQELPPNARALGGPASGYLPLYSDVVNITGIGAAGVASTANTFALQMSYDPTQVGDEIQAASGGFLYLGYRTSSGTWANAVQADSAGVNGGVAVTNFQGGWAAFTAQEDLNGGNPPDAPAHTLAQLLGSWGVDTVNHTVWAVVDSDAEFAVVPEPGTLALLAVAAIGLLGCAWRRRLASANG